MDRKRKSMSEAEEQQPPLASNFFGPLHFQDHAKLLAFQEAACPLCDDKFNLIWAFPLFLTHLFEVHSLVVDQPQHIDDLPEYLSYWKNRFCEQPMEEIIPSVNPDPAKKKSYYLLSSLLEEDKKLRHKLKLEHTIRMQDYERTASDYVRQCLFCRTNFEGTRYEFLDHLRSRHNLNLGDPRNLVRIDELVDTIDKKLNDLECLYCSKKFTDRAVLKEHMRKKQHKTINEHNREFDKFFIVNYLEIDKKFRHMRKEDDRDIEPAGGAENSDEEYSDWNEKEFFTCLFCDTKAPDINVLHLHMQNDHAYDFAESTRDLDYYQKVKMVNYIRKQVYHKKCINCQRGFETPDALHRHMSEERHFTVDSLEVFDQPEYFFPTFENDSFLYSIDDIEDC